MTTEHQVSGWLEAALGYAKRSFDSHISIDPEGTLSAGKCLETLQTTGYNSE